MRRDQPRHQIPRHQSHHPHRRSVPQALYQLHYPQAQVRVEEDSSERQQQLMWKRP